jgi:hypothetical protein
MVKNMNGIPEKYEYELDVDEEELLERIESIEAHMCSMQEQLRDLDILVNGLYDRLERERRKGY